MPADMPAFAFAARMLGVVTGVPGNRAPISIRIVIRRLTFSGGKLSQPLDIIGEFSSSCNHYECGKRILIRNAFLQVKIV